MKLESRSTIDRRQFGRMLLLGSASLYLAPRMWARARPGFVESVLENGGSLLHRPAAWKRFRLAMQQDPAASAALATEAAGWLKSPPITVVGHKHLAPSGDPHDYVSIPPYQWPDRPGENHGGSHARDGEVNPLFYEYDSFALERLCRAVPCLVAQAWLTESSPPAEKAGHLLRAWFVDPATRMNPHLTYAQMSRESNQGSAGGIIDTTSLVFLVDAIFRLPFNRAWTPDHLAETKAWFARYLEWLLTSDNGRREAASPNNHGTWFDAQVITYALFADRPDIARRQITDVSAPRVFQQIRHDGEQPHELARSLSMTYCTYNLLAFACIARHAARFGLDFWHMRGLSGSGILTATRWMLPYYLGERRWPNRQIRAFHRPSAGLLLDLAWEGTGDDRYDAACRQVIQFPWQRLQFSKGDLADRLCPTP